MDRQNVTFSISRTVLRQAKSLAACEDKTLSELIREALEERINRVSGFQAARNRQLRLLAHGFDLGTNGKITWQRDDLYERR